MSGGIEQESKKDSCEVDAEANSEENNTKESEAQLLTETPSTESEMKDMASDAATLLSLQSESAGVARSEETDDLSRAKIQGDIGNVTDDSNAPAQADIPEVSVDEEMLASTTVAPVSAVPVQLDTTNAAPPTSESGNTEPEATQEITIDQTSHISVSGADTAQLTPVPGLPGVSLISADGGGEDGNAIYLLVTGPVDGDGSGAIAVDAFANATLHSVPVEVSSDGSVVTASHTGVSSTDQGGQQISDPVAEILSTITSVARNAQANASQVSSSQAGTSVSFPTASEMSLAQDILALASSALSSSYASNSETKTDTAGNGGEANNAATTVTSNSADLSEEEVKKAAIEQESQQTDSEMPYFDNAELPHWARYLRDCRQVGDCYTGYVMNEMEMEKVLNMYKKETHSLFAIRQTPSPVREDGTVRLMWKSQYVPYDGIPFINVGRRATVMECEHGPRKKANAVKRAMNASSDELLKKVPNLTCPARVFIKKVRKFPEYKVESEIDAKLMRQLQEQALKQLREGGRLSNGEIRFYMQLPLPSAHHYHAVAGQEHPPESLADPEKNHVDPQVVAKITEVVRQGYIGAFLVRQIARDYVEKELFSYGEAKPPRHDKSYFPPMIEIQNIIQSVQSEIAAGTLKPLPPPATPPLSNKPKKRKSLMKGDDADSSDEISAYKKPKSVDEDASLSMDSQGDGTAPHPNTVSLTLPKSQLENLSVSNLTFDQLQQLAKIGLLALNNTAFGGSPVSMGTGDIEQTEDVAMAGGEIQQTEGVPVENSVEDATNSLVTATGEITSKSAGYKTDDDQTVTSEVATEVAASLVTT